MSKIRRRHPAVPARGLDLAPPGRYRLASMRALLPRALAWSALLFMSACTEPPAGVLTLAPAGMKITGACTPHPDGTLTMPAATAIDGVVYLERGAATVTITAKVSTPHAEFAFDAWLGGASIGNMHIASSAPAPLRFHTRVRLSGPTALHIAVQSAGGTAASSATAEVEKVVITQP